MNIYQPGQTKTSRMRVTPGKTHPASDFMDKENKPITFVVEFIKGVADVPSNLGQYMLDEGLAKDSPIILPN